MPGEVVRVMCAGRGAGRRSAECYAAWILDPLTGPPCLLAACSGSSLQADSNDPDPLVLVNAGANTSVFEETTVTLTGEATGQSSNLTFTWSVSPNITIVHDDNSIALATFVANP